MFLYMIIFTKILFLPVLIYSLAVCHSLKTKHKVDFEPIKEMGDVIITD